MPTHQAVQALGGLLLPAPSAPPGQATWKSDSQAAAKKVRTLDVLSSAHLGETWSWAFLPVHSAKAGGAGTEGTCVTI